MLVPQIETAFHTSIPHIHISSSPLTYSFGDHLFAHHRITVAQDLHHLVRHRLALQRRRRRRRGRMQLRMRWAVTSATLEGE